MSSAPIVKLRDVELHYFAICGRGEPIRLLLEDAGVPYVENNDGDAFFAKKWDLDEYRFNQLPRLKVNGLNLAQLDAILRYIAKARGYGGNGNLEDEAVADMLAAACEDLNVAYLSKVYSPDASKSPKGYFVYDHPSFAEFHLYYLLFALSHLNPALLANFPALSAWRETMSARQGIKAYETSGRRREMLNAAPTAQMRVV
ncbi:hypothetical protein EVJ58_g2389 [Rhodofomes roseus]|uniref:Glutathione S-transferase n=1 Tax=Rhodofomes roseus TaxID=34475 RepID=A0A4Y9YQC2_9APHY|nr:hypothetical protein EVJ58_g2389 [Rhodofomes roseus]